MDLFSLPPGLVTSLLFLLRENNIGPSPCHAAPLPFSDVPARPIMKSNKPPGREGRQEEKGMKHSSEAGPRVDRAQKDDCFTPFNPV